MLDNLVESHALSECGRDFLIANLDPMHDLQLSNLRGWPDVTTTASVNVCIKQSEQISIPTGNVGLWDLVVQMNPCLNELDCYPYSRNNDNFVEQVGAPQKVGMVTIKSYAGAAAGGPYGFGNAPTADFVIGLPAAYSKGKSRLVGLGVEITNTTSELYKQGTCTVYRFPQGDMDSKVRRYKETNTTVSTQQITFQPSSLSTAMLLSGTRQWKAAEGAYIVAAFNDDQNLALPAEYRQPVLYPSTADDISGADNTFPLAIPRPMNGSVDSSAYWTANRWAPINSGGAMLTGLSEQTTLTVTVNAYIELFPTPAEPELVVLAKPSAAYDPLAMTLITKAMESMPVGVPAADNGFGDWFAGLVSTWAPKIGDALSFIPGAGVVGTGAKWLADSYLENYRAPPTPNSRAIMRRPPPKRKGVKQQDKPLKKAAAQKKGGTAQNKRR